MVPKSKQPGRAGKTELTEDELDQVKGGAGFAGTEPSTQSLVSPRDAASGLPTGKRQHKPLG